MEYTGIMKSESMKNKQFTITKMFIENKQKEFESQQTFANRIVMDCLDEFNNEFVLTCKPKKYTKIENIINGFPTITKLKEIFLTSELTGELKKHFPEIPCCVVGSYQKGRVVKEGTDEIMLDNEGKQKIYYFTHYTSLKKFFVSDKVCIPKTRKTAMYSVLKTILKHEGESGLDHARLMSLTNMTQDEIEGHIESLKSEGMIYEPKTLLYKCL